MSINSCQLYEDFIKDPEAAIANPVYKNYMDENYVNIVVLVAGLGKTELIPKLVEYGYDLNQEGAFVRYIDGFGYHDEFYSTPIHVAVQYRKFETALALQKNGADVNSFYGVSPRSMCMIKRPGALYFCIIINLEKINFLFRELKANPNVADENGRTPLLEAVFSNHIETCKVLLESDADINAPLNYIYKPESTINGETPFLCALNQDRLNIIDLFVKSGKVDYSLKLKNGKGPIDLASIKALALFIDDMKNKGFDIDDMLTKRLSDLKNMESTQKPDFEKFVLESNKKFFNKYGPSQLPANYAGTLAKCGQCNYAVPVGKREEIMWRQFMKFETCQCGKRRGIPPDINSISNYPWQ